MVRFILIRGASTTIRNKAGQTAMELAEEIKAPNLKRDVVKMLGPPGSLDCLMLSTPTRKVNRQSTTLILFAALFFIVQSIVVINVYPHLNLWQLICNAAIVLICVIALTLSVVRDPGYLKPEGTDFMELLEVVDCT